MRPLVLLVNNSHPSRKQKELGDAHGYQVKVMAVIGAVLPQPE